MPRSRWVFPLVLVLVSSGLPYSATSVGAASEPASAEPASESSVAATTARTLVHDALGRLEAVIDPTQGVAVSTATTRSATSSPSSDRTRTSCELIEVTPDRGVPVAVTIQGTEFGGDAGRQRHHRRRHRDGRLGDGRPIVATIPEGAAGGPVAVTVPPGMPPPTRRSPSVRGRPPSMRSRPPSPRPATGSSSPESASATTA